MQRAVFALFFAVAVLVGLVVPAQTYAQLWIQPWATPNNGQAVTVGPAKQMAGFPLNQWLYMFYSPDEHTPIRCSAGTCRLWPSGEVQQFDNNACGLVIGSPPHCKSSTFSLTTTDPTFGSSFTADPAQTSNPASSLVPDPVFTPSCASAGSNWTNGGACGQNFDAQYVGFEAVLTNHAGTGLIATYLAQLVCFGGHAQANCATPPPYWGGIGLTTSADGLTGKSWNSGSEVISSDQTPPPSAPLSKTGGVAEGTMVNGGDSFLYSCFTRWDYTGGASQIQCARAATTTDGSAGSWTKYHNASWTNDGTNNGLGGLGDSIITSGTGGCTTPRQAWIVKSTNAAHSSRPWLMIFLCAAGWFYSTASSMANMDWTTPTQFFFPPNNVYTSGQPNWIDPVFFTSGSSDNTTIGSTFITIFGLTQNYQTAPHFLYTQTGAY